MYVFIVIINLYSCFITNIKHGVSILSWQGEKERSPLFIEGLYYV
jgi:hypothetical protein